MTPYKFFCILGLSASTFLWAQAQVSEVYPRPQHFETQNKTVDFQGLKLLSKGWQNLLNRTEAQKLQSAKGNWKLKIHLKKKLLSDTNPNNLLQAKGAYDLEFSKNTIRLSAKDSVGVFYGLQTLSQLVKARQLMPALISDFPQIRYRGVVEGFYGKPWSHHDRISQLQYYGRIKANTYIYGPKDDPFHSSPHWRKPYPASQAEQLRELVKTARANFVDFVWAIHPGQDIKWTDEDRNKVLEKFEEMYKLGVRSFAVFFDDISGEGTDAHKQAALMNFLHENFVKIKKDVQPLMICPTEYNKSWANPAPGSYLNILGDKLDPSVQIMWTGDSVAADITKNTLQWIQERIKRPALIWWNFPVNDYVRDHLLLGPSYGLEDGITARQMSGLLSNPMEHAEASKPAIFGVADYGWNTSDYQPQKAWERSIEELLPKSAAAYAFFAENNSDLGITVHQYRKEESTAIAPVIHKLREEIIQNQVNPEILKQVEDYYKRIITASEKLESKEMENPSLQKEIMPWLNDFSNLGKKGVFQIENYRKSTSDIEAYWNSIVKHNALAQNFKIISPVNDPNINPVTGTLVLRPFADFLESWNQKQLFQKITGDNGASVSNPGIGYVSTSIKTLNNAQLKVGKNQQIFLPPVLEVLELQPEGLIEMTLSQPISRAEITFQYESGAEKWLKIETSPDGINWHPTKFSEENKRMFATTQTAFQRVRIRSVAVKPVRFRMKEFSIMETSNEAQKELLYTKDLNLQTYATLKAGETLKITSPVDHRKEVVILSSSLSAGIEITSFDKKHKQQLQKLHGNFLRIPLSENTQSIEITPDKNLAVYEILWK